MKNEIKYKDIEKYNQYCIDYFEDFTFFFVYPFCRVFLIRSGYFEFVLFVIVVSFFVFLKHGYNNVFF